MTLIFFLGGGGGEEVRWKTVRTYGKILATPLNWHEFRVFCFTVRILSRGIFLCEITPKGYLFNDSIISNVSDIYKANRSTQVIGGVTVSRLDLSPLIQDNKFVFRTFVVVYPDKQTGLLVVGVVYVLFLQTFDILNFVSLYLLIKM